MREGMMESKLPTPTGSISLIQVKRSRLMVPFGSVLRGILPASVSAIEMRAGVAVDIERRSNPNTCGRRPWYERARLILAEGERLREENEDYSPPRVGMSLWSPFSSSYEIEMMTDVPPYWYAALLSGGCVNGGDPPVINFPTREHETAMRSFDTARYWVNPRAMEEESLLYDFISKRRFQGRTELFIDLEALESEEMSWLTAFVPENYGYGSPNDRLAFLRALLDYRGWLDERGRVQALILSPRLLEGLHWMVRSLGGWMDAEEVPAQGCEERPEMAGPWKITIFLPEYIYPFLVHREGYVYHDYSIPEWYVKSITSIPNGAPWMGIDFGSQGFAIWPPDVILRTQ